MAGSAHRKKVVEVPRKGKGDPRYERKRKRDKPGRSVVRVWADGSGSVQVGRSTVALMTGEEDVSKWSDEELLRGARKGVNRIPHMIPMRVYVELRNRMVAGVQHRFAAELREVVDVHMTLLRSPKTPAHVRMRAVEVIYDRVMGKAPEHVVMHDGDAPWKRAITNAIVGTDEQAALVEGVAAEMGKEGNGKKR